MSDILSQEEIDSLLGALSTGEIQVDQIQDESADRAAKVKPYDFYRPSKFSKEQIRTIYMLHETYGRLWSSQLSGILRNFVTISVSSVDQVTYQEFMQSIPNPTITSTFTLAPLEGKAMIEFSPTLGFPIIDRLLGGAGTGNIQARELTEIEAHIISNLIDEGMVFLKEAWSSMIDISPELKDIESNPLFVQIVPPSDMILLITLEARIGSISGIINIVYPYVVLEPILSLLSAQTLYAVGSRGASEETRNRTTKVLNRVKLPVSIILGEVDCRFKEILELEREDIILLNTKTTDELDVRVENIKKFTCIPGKRGKHLGVQIIQAYSEEDN